MTRDIRQLVILLGLIVGAGLIYTERRAWAGVPVGTQPAEHPGAALFTPGVIPRLRIEIDTSSMESLRQQPRGFVSTTVIADKSTYPRVALRLKGSVGSFATIDAKPSLTLDFSRFVRGGNFDGLRRFHLNNSVEDPSYANEKLASELFSAAGVPAPRVTRALVELNGRDLGLYVLKEGFTEDFLALHFKNISGELYEPEDGSDIHERMHRNSVAAPLDNSRAVLKRLASAALEPDLAERWGRLQAALDVKRFITFMALEVILGHRDGYCLARNNFRVYHDLDTGKMLFLPQGMDQLFGTAELPWQPRWSGLVAKALMDTTEGRRLYAAGFRSTLTNFFKVDSLTNRLNALMQELRPVLTRVEWTTINQAAVNQSEQIARRGLNLDLQLNSPIRRPLDFVKGVGLPEGWEIAEQPPQVQMLRTNFDGRSVLGIAAHINAAASWRTIILLPRGRYRFVGEAAVSSVRPLPFGVHHGAGLRIGGRMRQGNSLVGDTSWQILKAEFEVELPREEVQLVCELRASAGEAWFDLDSLRVLQLDNL